MLISGMVSCSSSPTTGDTASSDGRTEVEFWTMQLSPDFDEYFNTLIAAFEANNPTLAVRWVDVPWSAMESKILTAVSAGTAPDVVNLNPNFASQLASRDAWLNLDTVVTPELRSTYLPNIWQASTLGDTSFGLPWYLTTRVTIYNRSLLAAAGIDTPPTNYGELATLAQALKDKTGKYAFFATFVPEDSAEVLESLVQMGVTLVDDQGQAAFVSDAGRSAFQYWVDLYQKGLLPQEVLTQGHRRAIELYQAGETAILASSPEFLNSIAINAPTIAAVSAASPQISGTTGKKNVAVMNLVVPQDVAQRGAEHTAAAVQFALYVTNSENQLAFAKAANVLPSTAQALADYQTSLGMADPPTADPPDDAAPNGTPDTTAQTSDSVAQARLVSATQIGEAEVLVPAMTDVNLLQKAIYENLQAAMLGQKTVDQALESAAATWNSRR
ncbi:ABC transporter substrate-binding protein [Prochlorothrix hollandica]|uniref:ABC transporter substrate-binding protein n=1 Tax=Prochlorothrix hollandica PCC 9006 = CALU 1027 TaxID=317619 RepID=A0A0M2PUM1_PROHO|nr:ABC transporter substrate-binding protein [Prochlorothrix hollandica PCC 9006 = CALU 1027]